MAVEGDPTSSTLYIDDLNATYPTGAEGKAQGDDHLRLIKKAIKNTFPNIDAPVTATPTELNYVDITTLGTQQASKAVTADANNTVTVPSGGEINFAAGSQLQIGGVAVTADASELNKLDGVTVTTAEINALAGIGGTTIATQLAAKQAADADLTAIAGLAGTSGFLKKTATDTWSLDTNTYQATITGGATSIVSSNLTASRALVSDGSGKVGVSSVTSTELGLLSGKTNLSSLTAGSLVTTTSGTEAAFPTLPSTIKRIMVVFSGVSINSSGQPFNIQLGDSGGYETSVYASAVGTTSDTTGFALGTIGTASAYSGIVTLVNLTGNTWVASGVVYDNATPTAYYMAGTKTLSATLDRLRLYANGGTFDAGSANIFYE